MLSDKKHGCSIFFKEKELKNSFELKYEKKDKKIWSMYFPQEYRHLGAKNVHHCENITEKREKI